MSDKVRAPVCNMCGAPMDILDSQQKFGIDTYASYGSKYDEDHIKMRFCCKCMDKIIDRLVGECVISPVIPLNDTYTNEQDSHHLSRSDIEKIIGGTKG